MKAKIVRTSFGSFQDSPVPAEGEVRFTKSTHQNGGHADAAKVINKLSGDHPVKKDGFVVLIDNVKFCIPQVSNLLGREAEGSYSGIVEQLPGA